MSRRVVVLGGGPAGLYAALLLARRDIPVTLLERETTPGGLAGGTEIEGQRVDFGSHRLHPSIDPGIRGDLVDLLGDDLQLRRRNGRIRLGGTWISFPLSLREMVIHFPPGLMARLGTGAMRAVITPNRSRSFTDVVYTGLGRPMGDLFYFPYARKIWGIDPAELSGEQARRRISADSPWKLLRKAISRSGGGEGFYYPREGFGQIAHSLSAAAAAGGADIRLGSPVTSITGSFPELEVGVPDGEVAAGLVLSTLPITLLSRLLGPPERLGAGLDSLRYRAMVLVYLVVATDRWTWFDAHYFPETDYIFSRVSEPKNYRDGPDPAEKTVLCVEIPCDPGDQIWDMDDADLIAAVRNDIVRTGLPDPGIAGEVRRIRHAYPIYHLGAESHLGAIADWLDTKKGIVTFGRQGLFAHDNTHHALAMARDAVACVTDDLEFDMASWDEARQRFARHVVED